MQADLMQMVGVTVVEVVGCKRFSEQMIFIDDKGHRFVFQVLRFANERDPHVRIHEVCGEVSNLIGAPILTAKQVPSHDAPAPDNYGNTQRTHTWTFYTFETAKGSVTVKWLGESDGDHPEGVYYWTR